MVFWPCDFEANKDTARFIFASEFVAFLHDEYGEERMMEMVSLAGNAVTRRWFRWRTELNDNLIDVFGVDEFMVQVLAGELMVNDLPANCFAFAKVKRKAKHLSQGTRRDAVLRAVNGESVKDIADELQRSYSCVNKWVRDFQKAAA